MRKILILLLVLATTKVLAEPVTLAQLRQLTYTNQDCAIIDDHINWLELQQRQRGIPPTAPELLSAEAREYQSEIRIRVWALRIGCTNPDRYVVKKPQT